MEAILFASPPTPLLQSKTLNWGLRSRRIRPRPFWIRTHILRFPVQTRCLAVGSQDNEERTRIRQDVLRVSEMAMTMTIVSLALPQAAAFADVVEKKRTKTARKVVVMTPEERAAWTQGLPFVQERIPYTDVLKLKSEDRLKYIIKHPKTLPKARPDVILLVLDDDRVVRTVLPVAERDEKFWDAWDKLGLDSAIMDAYSPPLPKPKPQRSVLEYLVQMASVLKGKDQKGKGKTENKQLQEIRRAKMELEMQRKVMEDELKLQRKMKERAVKEQKKLDERQRKEQKQFEERQRKAAENRKKQQESVKATPVDIDRWSAYWYRLSYDEGVQYGLGAVFFVLFYQIVVLGFRKRQKDYEDRVKIEKAEAEERKKMKQLEYDMGVTDDALYSSTKEGQGIVGGENEEKLEGSEKNSDIKLGLQFMRSGARVRRAKGRRPPRYLDRGVDVKFSDVAGMGDIRRELEEIVEFFRYGERYRRRGSKIPTGILLCGEPGTGKTLLAKAVAGEAGVNFFSISASQFVEIYVGVGASRVRALYQEARENAPSVVFIDELDAVGRQRGLIKGSGGQERDATLNQLLTCLDGFEGKGEVITIAATNRPDILDSALVRPGRFDRKIYIPKPGIIGRIEILKVHARNKPMADDIDYNVLASITEGMVGAQLANILDIAALNIMREGRTEITTDDLLEAAQLEERGLPDTRERSMDMWRKLALNEAALAVVSVNFPDMKEIQMITIVPRSGEEKGCVRIRMDATKFEIPTISRQIMLDHITVQLAPRAADEIWHGPDQLCTIWAGTLDNARSAARDLVFAGLSNKEEFYGLYDCWYEVNRINEVDVEALRILNMCYERAKKRGALELWSWGLMHEDLEEEALALCMSSKELLPSIISWRAFILEEGAPYLLTVSFLERVLAIRTERYQLQIDHSSRTAIPVEGIHHLTSQLHFRADLAVERGAHHIWPQIWQLSLIASPVGVAIVPDEMCLTNGSMEQIIPCIPGTPHLGIKDLSFSLRRTDMSEFVRSEAKAAWEANFVLLNTFEDLDRPVIDALKYFLWKPPGKSRLQLLSSLCVFTTSEAFFKTIHFLFNRTYGLVFILVLQLHPADILAYSKVDDFNLILQQNRKLMDAVIDALIVKKTLRKDQFFHLVEEHGHLDPIPPQLIEVRNSSLAEFREKMMAGKHVSNSS